MGVAVYPRLEHLLRERNLTVPELARLIEGQYGLAVDPASLARLNSAEPVGQVDLAVAGAAAAVLGVGFGELFEVEAVPVAADGWADESYLDEAQSRRLAELFDRQSRASLTAAEQRELADLVGEYGRRFAESKLGEFARARGIPLEQARREADDAVEAAAERWRELTSTAKRRRRTRSNGAEREP